LRSGLFRGADTSQRAIELAIRRASEAAQPGEPFAAEALGGRNDGATVAPAAKRSPARPAADECFVAQRKVIDV
jgi:hypothetical protein